MNTPSAYIANLAETLTKITVADFFKNVHEQFYSDVNISFMEYFLELTEHDNEFIVHHSKLVEYGIMTSNQSMHVKEKLNTLGLNEGDDYLLTDIREQLDSGAKYSKVYMLTPQSFKKCLMRAKRNKNQPVDPVIYCDYYLLLERIHKLYTDYERLYSNKLLSMKDEKIDRMAADIKEMKSMNIKQSLELQEQSAKLDAQTARMERLLKYGEDTTEFLHRVEDDLTTANEKIDIAKSYLEEKCKIATKNTDDERKHHCFAATTFMKDGSKVVKFISGQKEYVDKTIAKYIKDRKHQVIIEHFYNANGVDLRNNAYEEFNRRREKLLKDLNEKNALDDKEFNAKLKREIAVYNQDHPRSKRTNSLEKKTTPKVKKSDITVKFTPSSFTYTKNDYISFEEVFKIILDVNEITQTSPMNTDDEDSN